MAQVVYVGTDPDGLEIPAAHVVAKHGKPVEVPDDTAKQLLERDDFQKTPPTGDKAPKKREG